ncbi:serine hydroxymethyltransferase [candidate division WOR-1 bacterium RIFCSPHIGHO2_01_FULL_53_15]|uniref:Serine hydroxymethyltransferase n=1 Tax=candidate division WOR-1 bacterium RIFCSPHIGHO2_01_FULL_53_15 TaxID=1802564 RepID=A0A1F4Q3C3_UNCSA|nr:MAG: serine hydroxymethyltransferase [candidate division WOR-1 bacterium RIFCSPHIGHO2_01_FULL_53_15]OGJ63739.1 MAG: serine hydroxymethyltransferase [Candidatus Peribacteria bacterium RIFCSPHIGHO2_02_FULL_53_20]OGJ65255.1 MAG: serine hydroxymethyltransferase [Candidatus Peribacteria bacterium RIFCSPHIGHO2_12_FULL_55_11]OGJ66963.1 MAG: serine hydroxymethyltransferase [Candidatus Peribacteria bacterium RIFCSPLOWO2_01_FULL_53_10]OGJ71437.1 MAG: serine hydroxymethyltransferase [Candidatus Peribac
MFPYNDLRTTDPAVYSALVGEMKRQAEGVELIASENYISPAVMETMGTVFNNKYSEGYPGKRYYGGQEFTDQVETLAIDRAKQLFRCGHANVQPHAGCPANVAMYFALLEPGDCVLGMDLSHGGHLSHGHPVTYLTKIFRFVRYGMKDIETGEIDYDAMRAMAKKEKPKILLGGFSAYPRELDYAKMKAIADEVGAYTVMDMAHIAGLIAGGALKNPFDYGFDVVTTTTHKTLRGPRGGMILSKDAEFGKKIDKSVFPGFQGGPIMQMIAAKAVAFGEALRPEFKEYAAQIIRNSKHLANYLMERGAKLITNGTDNHLMLVDCVQSWNIAGGEVETVLDSVGITLNKNSIPNDTRKPMDPSGVRLGTPAITTRGMKERDMEILADFMLTAIERRSDAAALKNLGEEVKAFCLQFPVPGIKV